MCIIIDNNKCGEFFKNPLGDDEATILAWIFKAGKIVIGGRLRREMIGNGKMRGLLVQLRRAGRLTEVDDSIVNSEEEVVSQSGLLISDDPHVIALALTSGARLVHTSDAALVTDFKNAKVVRNPRGKIFNGDAALLRRHGVCANC